MTTLQYLRFLNAWIQKSSLKAIGWASEGVEGGLWVLWFIKDSFFINPGLSQNFHSFIHSFIMMTAVINFLKRKTALKNQKKSEKNRNKKDNYISIVTYQDWWFRVLLFLEIYQKNIKKVMSPLIYQRLILYQPRT